MDFPTRTHTLRGWLAGALVLAAMTACSKAKESTADWKADQDAESATVPATTDSLSPESVDTMSSGAMADAGRPADAPAKPRAEPDPAATVPQAAPDSAPARSTLDTLSRTPTESATPADSVSWTEAENRDTTIESTPDSASDWNGAATGAGSTTEATAMATVPTDTSSVDTSMPVDTIATPTVEDTSVTAATPPVEEREYVAAPADPSPVDTTEPAAPATGYAEMARGTAIAPESDTLVVDSAQINAQADEQDQGVPEEPAEDVAEAVAAEPESAPTTAGANIMTGADVVSAMTRQGQQCVVAEPESDLEGVLQRDMSRTPADVNPCGLGAMVISSLATGVDPVNAPDGSDDNAAKLEDQDDRGY